MSMTPVETWVGADLSALGPIYPMVGSETVLVVIGVVCWLAFHVLQAGIEKRELEEDESLAHSPDRLDKVFKGESGG